MWRGVGVRSGGGLNACASSNAQEAWHALKAGLCVMWAQCMYERLVKTFVGPVGFRLAGRTMDASFPPVLSICPARSDSTDLRVDFAAVWRRPFLSCSLSGGVRCVCWAISTR